MAHWHVVAYREKKGGQLGLTAATLLSRCFCCSHFLLHFDTNPRVLQTMSSRLRADPRVIKWTTLKLGDRLDQITPRISSGDIDLYNANHPIHMGGGRTIEVDSRND